MKRIYQLFSFTVVAGLLSLFVATNADAQRGGGGHSGGGGGGSHGGGGGFHGGGGGGGFHGGGGFQGGGGHAAAAPSRGGGNFAPRSNYSGARPGGGYAQGGQGHYGLNRGGYAGGRTGYAGRPGYAGGRGGYYRPGAGGYYHGGGYRGGYYGGFRGGYYNHGGFYGRYYAPRLGFSIGILPYGYYPFYFGPDQYFYSGGYYYQQNDNQYTVVEPPVGAEITSIPSNAQSIVIDGVQYYEANGVYYLPITRDDGTQAYQIAGKDGQLSTGAGSGDYQDDPNYQPDPNQNQGYVPQQQQQQQVQPQRGSNLPQPGDVVQALPPNCRKVKIDNEVYYVDPANVYYHQERDQYGQKVYRVTDVSNGTE